MRIKFIRIITAKRAIYSNNNEFEFRIFSKKDSLEELTKVINSSFKENAEKGMHFVGATQNEKTTYKRIKNGVCLIALHKNRIIGTITILPTHKTKGCNWYNKSSVAKRNMLCIIPEYQKMGIGKHFILLSEKIAQKFGAKEIAVDTAENNNRLFNYYKENNYRFIETVKWKTTNYKSVVFSKRLI